MQADFLWHSCTTTRSCMLWKCDQVSFVKPTLQCVKAESVEDTTQDIAIPAASGIDFSYLSKKKKHHLFIAPTVCTYTTEICPKTDGEGVASPCSYKFPSPGAVACWILPDSEIPAGFQQPPRVMAFSIPMKTCFRTTASSMKAHAADSDYHICCWCSDNAL